MFDEIPPERHIQFPNEMFMRILEEQGLPKAMEALEKYSIEQEEINRAETKVNRPLTKPKKVKRK